MRTTTKIMLWALAFLLAFAVANTYGTRNARSAEPIPVPDFHGESLAHEVASQDWFHHLQSKQRRKACDLRGPNGGTVAGYRKAVRYVIRHVPSEGRRTRIYRQAIINTLENC